MIIMINTREISYLEWYRKSYVISELSYKIVSYHLLRYWSVYSCGLDFSFCFLLPLMPLMPDTRYQKRNQLIRVPVCAAVEACSLEGRLKVIYRFFLIHDIVQQHTKAPFMLTKLIEYTLY